MKERPILFSAPMVRAILAGTKTVTRRIVKPQPRDGFNAAPHPEVQSFERCCKHGQPGDRLWVREAWAEPTTLDPGPTFYRADYPDCVPAHFENVPSADQIKWKPSIHMRRNQSRITLEITDIHVERLQDISGKDILAEGAVLRAHDDEFGHNPVSAFDGCVYLDLASLWARGWESINGAGSWAENPWVWVISFRKF